MLGTLGNYKAARQDIVGKVRWSDERKGRSITAFSSKCRISWVCLKGNHVLGRFFFFLMDDRHLLVLSLFFYLWLGLKVQSFYHFSIWCSDWEQGIQGLPIMPGKGS